MRISDWSSDVCSSDLNECPLAQRKLCRPEALALRAEAVDRPPADETREEWAAQGAALWSPAPAIRAERSHRYSRHADGARCKRPASWVRKRMPQRSEEHTSELQSLMRISYAVFCLKKKNNYKHQYQH